MASLSAEFWPVVVSQPEVASEVMRAAAVSDVTIRSIDRSVVVVGRPLGKRRGVAWSTVVPLAPLWHTGIIPQDVALVIRLESASFRTTGDQMCAVAAGMTRAGWQGVVEVRLG